MPVVRRLISFRAKFAQKEITNLEYDKLAIAPPHPPPPAQNMQERLTPDQLNQIIAEVQQLSDRQQDDLEAEEVRGILRELSLPPELLEDALVQLRRREALAEQRRRKGWVLGGVAVAIALLLLGGTVFTQNQRRSLARITAQQDRITLAQDDGGSLSRVTRDGSELYYRITLADALVGQTLSLSCNWTDPSGQIVHQNRYQTQTITTPVWNTFCRHTLGSAAPAGTWRVESFLGDRPLSEESFEVE